MSHCNILAKAHHIPRSLLPFLSDSSILFTWTEAFVEVDTAEDLPHPYEYEQAIELIRIDRRVLRDLNDFQLGVVLFRAKIERDLYNITINVEQARKAANHILEQRYSEELLEEVEQLIQNIYCF